MSFVKAFHKFKLLIPNRLVRIPLNCLKLQSKANIINHSVVLTTKRSIYNTTINCSDKQIDQDNGAAFLDDFNPDESLYWDSVKTSLESEETPLITTPVKQSKFTTQFDLKSEMNVFVLQLKMQYKSKARQSTTADLQLAESISLVNTLDNWKVIEHLIIGSKRSNTKEIFGSGNQELLSKKIAASGANCLFVVIDRLTNLQVKSLRRTLLGNDPNIKIYDRYTIVLEIFKRNARSPIAKLQIALAEIPFIRYKFDNNDLYKNVEKKIHRELEAKLRTRNLLNNQRRHKNIPTISVFGYTNVGKTSFIKLITDDNKMEPKNKLFATLDVTYHGTSLSNSSQNIVFVDTIGFISDIPHNLIESFKTSLGDALNAHLLIHLVDISHPDREAQQRSVIEILRELAPDNKLDNMLTIYNKCDQIDQFDYEDTSDPNVYYISCKTGHNLAKIKEVIEKRIYKELEYIDIKLRVGQGTQEMAYLYKNSIIKETKDCDDSQYLIMSVLINKVNALKFVKLFPNVKISK